MISPEISAQGLSKEQVLRSRQQNGSNALQTSEDRTFAHVLKEVALEPMFIMLLAACTVYFFMGQYDEGIIMLLAILIVAGISFFQEYRSRNKFPLFIAHNR